MATFTSVATVAEEHGSASENWEREKVTCAVTLRCAWTNRHAVVWDLLGNRRQWPYNSVPARAVSVGVKPDAASYVASSQGMNYEDALLAVNYSTDQEADLISESLEPTAEFMQLDYKQFRWGSEQGDPLAEGEAPGRLVRGLALQRTLYKVQPPLPIALLDSIGCCNDAYFYSSLLGLGFTTGTLLYQPPVLSRTITYANGSTFSKGVDISMKFHYKPETWNTYWRSKSQSYEKMMVLTAGDGWAEYKGYEEADLSSFLF